MAYQSVGTGSGATANFWKIDLASMPSVRSRDATGYVQWIERTSHRENGRSASDPRIQGLRLRIQESLDIVAAQLAQLIALRHGFDALGDHLHRESIGHCQNRANHRRPAAFIVPGEIGDERSIDLQHLQRVLVQV